MSPKLFFPIVCYIGEICCCCLQNTQFCEVGVFLQKEVFLCKQSFDFYLNFITMHMHQESFQEIISNIHKDFSFKIFVLYTCMNFQSWNFFMVINHMLKYGFWKKSLLKNATLNIWTIFSSQKGICSNESKHTIFSNVMIH